MAVSSNKKVLIVFIHIAVWSCFLLLPFIFQQHSKDSPYPMVISNHFRAVLISSSIFLIFFYYINTQLLISRLLFKRNWFWYIASVIAFFIAFLYFPEWASSIVPEPANTPNWGMNLQSYHHFSDTIAGTPPAHPQHFGLPRHHFHFFPGAYWIFILVFTIGTCVSVIQQWLRLEDNKREIEKEKLTTELLFLKSQINPHFFFNTLNNIYSLAVTGSEKTAPTILKLSSIMRYIISDAQLNLVPLEKEIQFTKHIIDLQLVRLTDKVKVDFTIDGSVEDKMIDPLLFIPFVENALKYGVSAKVETHIIFHLKISDKRVIFSSTNSIVKSENDMRETTGIGINNVKRRLALLYPDKHNLQIYDNGETFSVKLEITI